MWLLLKKVAGCKLQVAFILVSAFCLLVSGCGFQPMYGDNSVFAQNTPLSGNLIIDPIAGHEGQIFRVALEDKLNPEGLKSSKPEYRLQVSFTKLQIPTVVKSDGTILRYDVKYVSKFRLLRTADGKELLTDTVTRMGSYNVTVNANFATYEAEQDTIERTLQELAEDYVLRLSGYFAEKK
jgi:LPS-assembly lipoprotein